MGTTAILRTNRRLISAMNVSISESQRRAEKRNMKVYEGKGLSIGEKHNCVTLKMLGPEWTLTCACHSINVS